MKICVVTHCFFPHVGGVEFVVHHLAEKLHQLGHQVNVLAPASEGMGQGNLPVIPYHVQPIDSSGTEFSSITDKYLRYERAVEQNLSHQMRKWGFDLLHAHSPYPSGYCAVQWGQQNQVPVVVTCHGGDVPQAPNIDHGVCLDKKIAPKTYALQHGDIITVASRHLMERVIAAGCPQEKIRLIPNGVDLKSFENTDNSRHNNGFILAMGRFNWVKGFDLLLEAFYKVAQINRNVDLVIAGFASKKYRDIKCKYERDEKYRLLDFALKYRLGQRVKFKPLQLGADKLALFNNCLFFVCPSQAEGFGLVVLEAMAAGKPVVAFNVGGVSDIVQSGVNGILVKPYDIDELAQAMLKLLDSPQLQGKMSAASRKIASDYDWSIIAQKYVAMYTELLNAKSN